MNTPVPRIFAGQDGAGGWIGQLNARSYFNVNVYRHEIDMN